MRMTNAWINVNVETYIYMIMSTQECQTTLIKVANHVVSMMGFTDFLNVILSQISCGKVQNPPHIFPHKTESKFLLGLV